jgi:16S rRNA (cytidine1402-2'-O)-methyltransferase
MSDRRGALVVCPTPIGNLSDVTLRVLEELRRADVAACEDTRHSRRLLERYDIDLPLVSLTEHNEASRTPELLRRIVAGDRVCLLSDAGTPAVSDPGARLIAAILEAGLEAVVLPGPSAVTTALVASGMGGGGFVFAGFLPRGRARVEALLDRLDATGLPLVAYESPRRLPATLRTLAARSPERPVAVCRELTKLHEQVVRGPAAELAERFSEAPRGEVTVVLGAARPRPSGQLDREALGELAAEVGARRAAQLAAALTGRPRNRLYRLLTGAGGDDSGQ